MIVDFEEKNAPKRPFRVTRCSIALLLNLKLFELVLYNNNTILALGINTRAKLNKYTFIKSRFWFRDTPLKLSGAVTRIYQLVGIAIIQKCFSNYHEPAAIPQEKKGITGYKMVRCFQMVIKFEDENFKSTIYTYLKPPYGKLSWSLA